jgi:hypothetical protein
LRIFGSVSIFSWIAPCSRLQFNFSGCSKKFNKQAALNALAADPSINVASGGKPFPHEIKKLEGENHLKRLCVGDFSHSLPRERESSSGSIVGMGRRQARQTWQFAWSATAAYDRYLIDGFGSVGRCDDESMSGAVMGFQVMLEKTQRVDAHAATFADAGPLFGVSYRHLFEHRRDQHFHC